MKRVIIILSYFLTFWGWISSHSIWAEPFTLADGTVIEALKVQRDRGIVKSIEVSYTSPISISTPWGTVPAVGPIFLYPSGRIQKVTLGNVAAFQERTAVLGTPFGSLTVKDEITFHENGSIASLSFKGIHQIPTPLGIVPALRATFYPSGSIMDLGIPSWNPPALRFQSQVVTVTELEFHENGTVKYAQFKGSPTISTPGGNMQVERVWFYDNGNIKGVVPTQTVLLAGPSARVNSNLKIPARSIDWYSPGELRYIELANPVLYPTPYGNRMVSGTLYWYPDGKEKELNFALDPPEITLAALGLHKVKVSYLTFYSDGSIETCSFPELTPIQTPAGKVETRYLTFYPKGALKYVNLSDAGEAGKEFPLKTPLGVLKAGWMVSFYDNGNLEHLSFLPKTAHEVNTPVGKAWVEDMVSFYPGGALKKVQLSTATELPTPLGVLPLDWELEFYPEGTVKKAQIGWDPRLGEPKKVKLPGLQEAFIARFGFYPSGTLRFAELLEEGVFGGIQCRKYDVLLFDEAGKLAGKESPLWFYKDSEKD